MSMSNECSKLLRRMQELEFIAVELNLYLDTHPNDTRAIMEYNRVSDELKRIGEKYISDCGPHLGFGLARNNAKTWLWAEQPWPWEV